MVKVPRKSNAELSSTSSSYLISESDGITDDVSLEQHVQKLQEELDLATAEFTAGSDNQDIASCASTDGSSDAEEEIVERKKSTIAVSPVHSGLTPIRCFTFFIIVVLLSMLVGHFLSLRYAGAQHAENLEKKEQTIRDLQFTVKYYQGSCRSGRSQGEL